MCIVCVGEVLCWRLCESGGEARRALTRKVLLGGRPCPCGTVFCARSRFAVEACRTDGNILFIDALHPFAQMDLQWAFGRPRYDGVVQSHGHGTVAAAAVGFSWFASWWGGVI